MNIFTHQAVSIGEISTLTNYLKFNFEYVVEDCRKFQDEILYLSQLETLMFKKMR